jgi:hypothetical protein
MTEINLPAVIEETKTSIALITQALGVPRDILNSDEEIEAAWANLPRVLSKIPAHLRSESLVRMCVAVQAGLFDGAINYIWNAAILELREKVRRFGLNVVRQIISKSDFDEQAFMDLKDAELLDLCLKLNLINEDGYFFLDQCRDIRNNFSAAHPVVGKIDDNELIAFINRCAKYAIGDEHNPVGVDIQAFIAAIKAAKFTQEQLEQWTQILNRTHEAQRELLFVMIHGIYCDPASSEESRLNALSIANEFAANFAPKTMSDLIDRHQEYSAKGDSIRHTASQQFFEKLGLLGLLSESERHSLISNACKKLISVHQAFDNFYNEPPFAERLDQITSQGSIPDTIKPDLVETVVRCAVGNRFGTSHAAYPFYANIIKNFSPGEIALMIELPGKNTGVANAIRAYNRCKEAFKQIVRLIDINSVPTKSKKTYQEWLSN